ncbi:MAG: hypothetical protein H0V81_05995 [Solirubrobacterales bacterium]|nr:hypothetical protein [Solirubrobacterales bacterium]
MTSVLAQASDTVPDDNTGYVAAAYLVFFALALIYFGIMAFKLQRLERELVELNELADRKLAPAKPDAAPAETTP